MQQGVPSKFKTLKDSTYETRYIYTGMSRYDTEKKLLSKFVEENGKVYCYISPYTDTLLSRGYHTEHVRITVYSESPRIWAEEVSPHEVYFFQEVR